MIVNMLGAIIVVPAFYSIVRPKLVTSRLRGPGEVIVEGRRSLRRGEPGWTGRPIV